MKFTIPSIVAAGALLLGAPALFGQQPSMQTHTQNGQTLVNYLTVPGWDDPLKAPLPVKSPHFEIRVRSAATGNQWVPCFANYTYNRAGELPDILPTDGTGAWVTVVQAYQKFTSQWSHSYANIEMSENSPVEVEVSKIGSTALNGSAVIVKSAVHPAQKVYDKTEANGKVYFKINNPCQVVIDINGQMDDHNAAVNPMPGGGPVHAISLFANAVIAKPASSGPGILSVAPGVMPVNDPATYQTMVFQPGVHDIGADFKVYPGKSYYLPGDAVVFGSLTNVGTVAGTFRSNGDSIQVYGCGTLSGQRLRHYRFTQPGQPASQNGSRALVVENAVDFTGLGVTLVDAANHSIDVDGWSGTDLTPGSTSFRWMKTITWRANGDGFGGYQLVEDSFIRTADDGSYIKGNKRRCTFWKDANAALFHMATAPSGPIAIEDCDVIYSRLRTSNGSNGGGFQQRGEGSLGVYDINLTVKDFRCHDPRPNMSIFNMVSFTTVNNVVVPAQSYRGIRFENMTMAAPVNGIKQRLLGCAEAPWFGGLIFKDIYIGGQKLTQQNFSTYFTSNEFVDFLLFDDPQNLNLTITADAIKGTVTKSPDQATHPEMSFVTLTAVPKPSFIFTGWSGAVTSTANPLTIRLTDHTAITANFGPASITDPVTISTPSTGTWIVPPRVYSATFQSWGGGGAGGSAQHTPGATNVSVRGGGGAGGGYASKTLRVRPGQVISYNVGVGGAGSVLTTGQTFTTTSFSGAGAASSASLDGGAAIVQAVGGPGGQNRSGTTGSVGGNAVTALTSGGTGDVVFYGGNGGAASPNGTGGGGGSAGAGPNGNGGPGSSGGTTWGAGAAGPGGGVAGAPGHNNTANGNAGGQPGAGGSGAAVRNNTSPWALRTGGKGGDGRMIVTYNTMAVNFTLTTQAANGSITRSLPGPSYPADSSITLTAVADPGYRFVGWSGAGFSGTAPTITVDMDDDKTITATFIQQFTLTTNAGPGGSISAGGTFDAGTEVTVTAAAASGYRFGSWSGTASGSTNPLTFVMNGNHTVTANFIQQFTLTTTAVTGGSISPGGVYDAGTSVTVAAAPSGGYRFGSWSGDASGTSTPVSIVMNSDKSVAATFVQQFTLSTSAGTGGTVVGGGTYDAGTSVTVTASPSSGYRFGSWSGNASGTSSSAILLMDGSKSASASFVKTYTLTSSVVGGTIMLDPAGGTYDSGTSVTITATPGSPELSFLRWTGDLAGQANGCTLTMNADFTFAAEFLGTLNLTTPGTSTWTVPAGVSRVTLSAWGGGGAGGSAAAAKSISSGSTTSARGGGGAGGGFARTTFRVAPALPVTFTIGQGGIAPATVNANNSNSEAGGDTSAVFKSVAVLTAKGGLGGKNALVSNGVSNVNGGAAQTGHIGTLVFNGGSGANASPNGTGGGGGSAGSTGHGGNAPAPASSVGPGGAAGSGPAGETGAVGGTGHNGTGIGGAGGTPGAGGSGAGVRIASNTGLTPVLTHRAGGSGGNGRLIVTYIVTPSVPEVEILPANATSIIGSEVEVRWPLSYANWFLEESHTADEAAAVWIEIPSPYQSDASGIFWRTPDLTTTSSFFRLSQP